MPGATWQAGQCVAVALEGQGACSHCTHHHQHLLHINRRPGPPRPAATPNRQARTWLPLHATHHPAAAATLLERNSKRTSGGTIPGNARPFSCAHASAASCYATCGGGRCGEHCTANEPALLLMHPATANTARMYSGKWHAGLGVAAGARERCSPRPLMQPHARAARMQQKQLFLSLSTYDVRCHSERLRKRHYNATHQCNSATSCACQDTFKCTLAGVPACGRALAARLLAGSSMPPPPLLQAAVSLRGGLGCQQRACWRRIAAPALSRAPAGCARRSLQTQTRSTRRTSPPAPPRRPGTWTRPRR